MRAFLLALAFVATSALAQVGGPLIGQASLSTAAITGGTITGATIDNSVIGGTTPAAGTFTTATATSAFLGPAGSNTNTSFGFTAQAGTGFYQTGAGSLDVAIAGVRNFLFQDSLFYILSNNATIYLGASQDAVVARDAAATIAIKNGATAQAFRVYGTTTGPKYVSLSHDGTNGIIDTAASSGLLSIAPTNATTVTIGKALTQATSITSSTATFPITGLAAAAGGSVSLIGGAGSSTTGGAVAITGGAATSGAGSSVTITAGAAAGGTNSGGDVNLVPTAAVSTGTPGEVKINSARGFFDACWQQYLPASVPVTGTSYTFFMANRAYRVVAASIINSSTSTVPTVDVTKDTGTTAPGAGSTVLTGVMTFSATANTRVAGTIIGTVATTNLAAGDRLAAKWAGTVGSITGAMVCVTLVPI